MPRSVLIFICLLMPLYGLLAQSSPEKKSIPQPDFVERPIMAKLYGVNDGLSQGLVYSMTLDHYGRLWLATKDGLNCYTGQEFRVYRKNGESPYGMAHDQVRSLSTDSLGRIWLVYVDGSLGLFDPSTQRFSSPKTASKEDVPFEEILQLEDGLMLLRTTDTTKAITVYSAEVHYNKGEELHFQPLDLPAVGMPQTKNLYDKRANIVQQNGAGVTWLATPDSVFRFGPKTNSSESVWSSFAMPQVKSGVVERYVNFTADLEGSDAFVVDSSLVLRKYDPERNEFLPVLRLPEGTNLQGGSYLDSKKRLYLFHNNAELLRIDTRSGVCERLIPQWNREFLSLNLQMRTALEDAQGNVWIGTPGAGMVQISCSNDRFVAFNYPYTTYEDGLYKYRTESPGKIHHCNPSFEKEWIAYRKNLPSEYAFVSFAKEDAEGSYWVGVNEGTTFSLKKINRRTKKTKTWLSEIAGTHTFGRHFFFGRDGKLWVNINKSGGLKGLESYNPLTNESATFPIPPMPVDGDYTAISDWHETPEGNWWLATIEGLIYFNTTTGYWKHFTHQKEDTTSISGDLLLSICPDPSAPGRYLWIGTEGAGLNRLDLRDSTFQTFNTEHGLPNNVIYGILPDNRNNLWISTNQGISHFIVREHTFLNYTARDGLAGNEFNRYEYAMASDGSLYFAGTAGLTIIHPEEFYKERSAATTLITGLKVQNRPVQFNGGNSEILQAPIHTSTLLELPYDHRMFSFNFANMDLSNPRENEFKYMLEGFDRSWIEAGTAHEATYTNLNPGKYRFKVLGRNNFKVWNESPTTIDITILAPWWGTWWFRSTIVLLVLIFLWGLYKYRIDSILRVERMRNQIAQDLHDEIGSTLSSISLYSAVMKSNEKALSQKSQPVLDRIITNVSDIMEKMNDMVWTIKSDNDGMDQVVNRMRAFAAEMSEARGIRLAFDSDPAVEKMKLDMNRRKEVYLIFKEAVNNAVKYSEASELSVQLRSSAGMLCVSISDNGTGFDIEIPSQRSFGGNGIPGMKKRAERINAIFEISSKEDSGTEIIVNVPINH